MIRTQIQLTEEQSGRLKQVAAERCSSMAEVIRQGVDYFLRSAVTVKREERVARAMEAAGRFHSGKSDVSVRHDDYLADDYPS